MYYGLMFAIDKAPRLTIRRVIWILASDTVFVNSTNISTNIETAMLSSLRLTFARLTPLIEHSLSAHIPWKSDLK